MFWLLIPHRNFTVVIFWILRMQSVCINMRNLANNIGSGGGDEGGKLDHASILHPVKCGVLIFFSVSTELNRLEDVSSFLFVAFQISSQKYLFLFGKKYWMGHLPPPPPPPPPTPSYDCACVHLCARMCIYYFCKSYCFMSSRWRQSWHCASKSKSSFRNRK